jgi:Uma2 family endonuclease
MSTTARFITADELLRLPGDQRRELVKGEVRRMAPAGFEQGRITMKLARLLANFVDEKKLGVVLGVETGFILARNPDTVRAADVSFVAASRLTTGSQVTGYWEGLPDLAVEVVSPNDTLEDVEEKVDDYLAADTPLIWVINPRRRTVTVPRARAQRLRRGTTTQSGRTDVVPARMSREPFTSQKL